MKNIELISKIRKTDKNTEKCLLRMNDSIF